MRHMDPDDLLGKAYDPRVARRLLGQVGPYRPRFVGTIGLIVLVTVCELLIPQLFALAVDEVVGDERLWVLNLLGAAFVATLLVRFLASWGQYYQTAWLGNRVVFDLRNQMFRHLQTLSMRYIDERGVGRIMTRIQNDVSVIQELFADGITHIASSGLVLVGIVILMLITNWQMALLAYLALPLMVVVMRYWRRGAVETYRDTRRTISVVNANLAESIAGVRVSQAFTREPANIRGFDEINMANYRAAIRAAKLSAVLFPIVTLIGSAAMALLLYFGGQLYFDVQLSLGDLVLFIALIDRFFEPIRDLSQQYTTLQAAMVAGERIFEVLDVEPEVRDAPDAYELPPIAGRVDYNDVTFGYGGASSAFDVRGSEENGQTSNAERRTPNAVLHDIDLHVAAGETVAYVGETGAGKSSMVNLLMRFYDVWDGSVTIDGHDVRGVTQESLRSQLGVVLQDTFLFAGTVRENIRFGRPDASNAQVEQAARDVGAHGFIEHLPQSYDTEVQERGASLSVGQRQLLSFARALLSDPRILILDEATSSIDTQTERVIQQALRRLLKGRTAFVIAHRLSTIREAEKVVVMHHGRIVELGTHDELVARGGYYADLYAMQFQGGRAAD